MIAGLLSVGPDVATATPRRPAHARTRRTGRGAWTLLALGLACWLVALPSLPAAPVSEFGLLVSGSHLLLASMLVIALAFAAAVRAGRVGIALAATIGMVVAQRLTVTLVTQVPLYSWTYKHLGVVDYIRQNGHLARDVDIYNGWPGLFSATAWFSQLTGVSAVTLAHWFTPAVHVLMVALMIVLARAWGASQMSAVVAAFLFESLDWVGQDYYSPQATALMLALGMLAVVGLCRERRVALPLVLLLFAAITVTHQLTPYWLVLACGLLAVTKRLRPRWLPVLMALITAGYLALNWRMASHFTLLSLNPVANAHSNIATVGVFGQVVTSELVRLLSLGLWSAALLSAFLERRRGRPVLARLLLAFSPFLILGGQGYGGEAIFRVFLYSLPGCALLIAPVLTRMLQGRMVAVGTAVPILLLAVTASAQGYYGGWFANLMTNDQLLFSEKLLSSAHYPSYLTVAAPVWPERPAGRYVQFARFKVGYDYPMVYAAKLVGATFETDKDYATFNALMDGRTGGPTYLIISRQMKIYDWYFGILPLGALDRLKARMLQDPRWTVVYDTDAFTVFETAPATASAPAGTAVRGPS